MASTQTAQMTLLPVTATPPRSKTHAYYAIHPTWQDVSPIPQSDMAIPGEPDPGPALASIAYSPRYAEAMSYLRAVMARNEISERAIALTSDLITMNPAHYTVWIYRMMVLQGLWSQSTDVSESASSAAERPRVEEVEEGWEDESGSKDSKIWQNVEGELMWLNDISAKNLKNYQIWHHRHALVNLLPPDPSQLEQFSTVNKKLEDFLATEQRFLAFILSQDTKNYHVWSYRQWLCTRYPSIMLPTHASCSAISLSTNGSISPNQSIADTYIKQREVVETEEMILDDIRNNSAWSHRYFLLFGQVELTYATKYNVMLKKVNEGRLLQKAGCLDSELVATEIEYTKSKIRIAPQNASPWNYLRGVVSHGGVSITETRGFCEEFLGPAGDLWADQYSEVDGQRRQTGVRSSHAVEWLGEIYGVSSEKHDQQRSRECYEALGQKWDTIREKYWEWKLKQVSEQNSQQTQVGS